MRKIAILFLTLILATAAAAGTHSGNYTMTFDLSAHISDNHVRLWIPYPVSDTNQKIDSITWSGNYAEAAVYTDQANGTPMLFVRWERGAGKRTFQLSFDAERSEQSVNLAAIDEGPFNPSDFTHYLAATSLGPTDGGVKLLADSITAGKTSILDKARAIYDWTVDNTYRDPATRGCGIGDVNAFLKHRGGKCADISSIFVALSRAAGVPAREIFGIRSGRDGKTDVSTWQHCWAEFYLPGYGWVPVDPADVRKAMLKQKLDINDPQVGELREYFWGGVDPYRVRLGEGRDLELNPRHAGPPLNYLMYPFAQVGKETLDWLAPETFRYTITWQPL